MPPFFINNSQENKQGKSNQNEILLVDSFGKRTKEYPMNFWGCEGDHLYRDCPHKGESLIFFHNIQYVETVEDIGGNMPRIYATLDNKQEEYQSPII
jgi:hypothetical protein